MSQGDPRDRSARSDAPDRESARRRSSSIRLPPVLRPNSGLRARLHLGGTLAIGQLIGRGAVAAALLLLVRELRPTDFSTLALALAVAAILGTVADAGFARLLVRDTARAAQASAWLVRELLRVRLIAVAGTALLAALALQFVPNPFVFAFGMLLVAYLALESIAVGYENAAAGVERPWRFVLAQSVSAMVLLGGLIVLIREGSIGLMPAMAVMCAASATKVGGHMFAWRRRGSVEEGGGTRVSAFSLFRRALPFLGLTLMSTVYYKAGIVALYSLRGAAETASYAAALRVVDAAALLTGVAFLAVSPTLSRMHRDEPEKLWSAWRGMAIAIGCVAVPLVALVGVVAPALCGLLFGETYRASASQDLRLMLPGVACMLVQAISAAVVFMGDRQRDALILGSFNLVVCLVAAVGLSAAMGSAGAALALSLAELVSVASFALLIRYRYGPSRLLVGSDG